MAMAGSAALSIVDESMVEKAPSVIMAACIHNTGGMASVGRVLFVFLTYLSRSIFIKRP
jgi:hypothetical protein